MTSLIVGTLVTSLIIGGIVWVVVFIVRRLTPPRCAHDWKTEVRLYKKPLIPKATVAHRHSADDYLAILSKHEALMHGETLVLLSCKRCGAIRERTYPGIVTEPDISRNETIGHD